nr:hypothetical protein [uncultured Prevotella sp.]
MNKLLVKALTDSTDEQMKQKTDAQRPKGQRMHRPAACIKQHKKQRKHSGLTTCLPVYLFTRPTIL